MAQQPQIDPLERETIRRVAWRLMPLLMLGYFCAYLDRVNVGFAGLTMNKALGFSAAVFGFGSGVFFVGYFLFEIPSNLILNKVGARRWIARILHLGPHRIRVERLELLYCPIPAWSGGGRILSGHRALPHLVVPVLLPLAHDGDLSIGQRDLADHRPDRLIAAFAVGRLARSCRLAVAVHRRGTAADHHVLPGAPLADRPAA
jgi:MFS family permease